MFVLLYKRLIVSFTYRIRFLYYRLSNFYWSLITKVLISNKREMKLRDSLFIWVPVWGEKHINWFFDYTLPSLVTRNNLPLVAKNKNVKICFYTNDNDAQLIENFMNSLAHDYEYSINIKSNFKDKARDTMSNFLIHILEECIENNAMFLVALPDFIFSDGSINNLVTLSDGKGVSISVAHPRVSIEELEKYGGVLNNNAPDLVETALKFKHKTLLLADELKDNNSSKMGVATRDIPNGLAVIHNLPAVFLCNPNKEDVSFFKRRHSFNIIDKVWPHFLFRQSRLKVVTSSDIAFIIELTHDSVETIMSQNMKLNDQYGGIPPFVNYSNAIIGLWRPK